MDDTKAKFHRRLPNIPAIEIIWTTYTPYIALLDELWGVSRVLDSINLVITKVDCSGSRQNENFWFLMTTFLFQCIVVIATSVAHSMRGVPVDDLTKMVKRPMEVGAVYSMVSFLQNAHHRHPIHRPLGRYTGAFCELKVLFMWYCSTLVIAMALLNMDFICEQNSICAMPRSVRIWGWVGNARRVSILSLDGTLENKISKQYFPNASQ